MTGAGTNTYLVGTDDVAVVDAGPAIPEHIDRILKAGAGKITRVVCTHTHPDHSPAASIIARQLGVPMIGAVTEDDQHQDTSFKPERQLVDGECIVGHDWQLRAIATPGHVDNHFCFLLEEEGLVFAGDHIMNGSTVVIVPPGGNMKAYIESLERLLDFPVTAIAPGHGEIIPDCRAEVEKLVRHRLMREAKVVAGLKETGPATLDELVVVVYNDVDPALHEWAKLSMLAHLIKLDQEQKATEEAGRWRLSSV
ncbi:MAG: MBL fold metallo-hydrolase [Cellvibrionales bacterium]|nr:MBL fold metallo-hydrolase [Cellvibrionales bacterium]